MYKNYYLMQAEPFSPVPSPEVFYKSERHGRTWQHLVDCLQKKEPVVLTAGDYGTGKTLLCLKLIHLMKKNNVSPMVYIPSSGYRFSMLLEKIMRVLDIPVDPNNETECQRLIYEYFESEPPQKNKYMYIVIDDIHEFGFDFIVGLSQLITFNHYGYFPIKLFMFGHSSFLQDLDDRNLISFKQRIKTIPMLFPLSVPEVTEYIYFRLISSGASGSPVFDESAIEFITSASKGIPRLINRICDISLLVACRKKTSLIDRKTVEQAVGESGSGQPEISEPAIQKPAVVLRQEQAEPAGTASRRLTPIVRRPGTESIAFERNDLFSAPEVNEPDQPRKGRKPMDLKKTSFLDMKTLLIACLILIIVLMTLFLFRDVRLSDVSGSATGMDQNNNGGVTKLISESPPENDGVVFKTVTRYGMEPENYVLQIPLPIEVQN